MQGMLLAALVLSCATPQRRFSPCLGRFLRAASKVHSPRFAILPFRGQNPAVVDVLWRSFFGCFALKPFEDVELARVKASGVNTPAEAMRLLGADFAIEGNLLTCERTFLGIYSHVHLSARLRIWGAGTAEPLLDLTEEVYLREGNLPLSPWGVPLASLRAGLGLRNKRVRQAAEELGRRMAARIPEPGPKRWYLQLGSFSHRENARRFCSSLRAQGLQPFYLWEKGHFRVFLGPYTQEGARQAQTLLQTRGIKSLLSSP